MVFQVGQQGDSEDMEGRIRQELEAKHSASTAGAQ